MIFENHFNSAYLGILTILFTCLAGCVAPQPISISQTEQAPMVWQTENMPPTISSRLNNEEKLRTRWLSLFSDAQLNNWVHQAVKNNPNIKAARYRLAQIEQSLLAGRTARMPSIRLGLNIDQAESGGRRANLQSSAQWNLDVWSKLKNEDKARHINYAAAKLRFKTDIEMLAANVTKQWIEIKIIQQLLDLYLDRVALLQHDLDVVESGYKRGLHNALDVYLARNNLNTQRSRLSFYKQRQLEISRKLGLLLGEYPSTKFRVDSLDISNQSIAMPLLPAQILMNRTDLQAKWLDILVADARLAAAYKARFPSFSLTSRYGTRGDSLVSLIRGGGVVWNLGAAISQSLFDAGRLEAEQTREQLHLRELEQKYRAAVNQAFNEVENALVAEGYLTKQAQLTERAKKNALYAEQRAFDLYQRGLENYTVVLDAKRRSLDAQINIIELQRSILINRVDLVVALGGQSGVHYPLETLPLEKETL